MATFLNLQNNIENGYLLRTDLTQYVQDAINRAIAKYSKERLWFVESQFDWVTTQGQWSYAVPTIPDDIRQIDWLRIQVNNVYYHVIVRDAQFIFMANVNNNQGQPTDWAWYQEQIYFYPVPNKSYPITLYYQKTYAPLVNPTDNNDWTNNLEAQDLIEKDALAWLYSMVILDTDKTAQYKQEAKEARKSSL